MPLFKPFIATNDPQLRLEAEGLAKKEKRKKGKLHGFDLHRCFYPESKMIDNRQSNPSFIHHSLSQYLYPPALREGYLIQTAREKPWISLFLSFFVLINITRFTQKAAIQGKVSLHAAHHKHRTKNIKLTCRCVRACMHVRARWF